MKIAIPADEKNMGTNVCASFGRTPWFLIYDDETKEYTFLDNSAASESGGAGIKAAQAVVDNKADVLLTPRCGENAANVLKAANIKIFKTNSISAKENLEAFAACELTLLDEIHGGFHGHGGN